MLPIGDELIKPQEENSANFLLRDLFIHFRDEGLWMSGIVEISKDSFVYNSLLGKQKS